MDSCTFPRYSENDIITHIRSCLLTANEAKTFSKGDLFPNVKPEVLQMIFMRALQVVYGIRLEHFYMMPVSFESPYPQIFDGFLPIANLFSNMERFFPLCRVNDFLIVDILNPKAKRTARFLSGLINFLFFRDSRREVYLEIQSTFKSAVEKEQRLQTAIQEATLKLEKLDTVPADQEAEFKELSQDIQELEQKLNHEYRQKTALLQEEIFQKKTEVAEKAQKLNEQKLILCNLKEEQKQLKSKIADDPEELANRKEQLQQTVQKLKKDKQEVIKKYESYRDLVEILPPCQQEIQLYQKKMETQVANMTKLSNVFAEIRTLEEQIESNKSKLKNGKMEEITLRRQVTVKRERLTTAEIKLKKTCEDIEQRKQAITQYCSKFQEKRGAVYEKLTATHAEIKQLKSAIQQLNSNAEKEKLKAQEICLSLRVGLDKYHEHLASIVEKTASGREEKIAELTKLL
ncbi:kinetochore protein Nuf2 [Lacerta agilis]|uniref:kinetochore protein Nuf2 n=1 Tax=Lacerta agilis TaxID=80427 RepID=UPI0014196F2E|nr:kinetochore protein Nuf2 [Lacerta agilis]